MTQHETKPPAEAEGFKSSVATESSPEDNRPPHVADAVLVLEGILQDATTISHHLRRLAAAFGRLTWSDRFRLGEKHPELAEALIDAEDHVASRRALL